MADEETVVQLVCVQFRPSSRARRRQAPAAAAASQQDSDGEEEEDEDEEEEEWEPSQPQQRESPTAAEDGSPMTSPVQTRRPLARHRQLTISEVLQAVSPTHHSTYT